MLLGRRISLRQFSKLLGMSQSETEDVGKEMLNFEKYPEFRMPHGMKLTPLQVQIIDSSPGLTDAEIWEVWNANEQPGHPAQIPYLRDHKIADHSTLNMWFCKVFDDLVAGDLSYNLGENSDKIIDFMKHLESRGVDPTKVSVPKIYEMLLSFGTLAFSHRRTIGRPPFFGNFTPSDLHNIRHTVAIQDLDEYNLPLSPIQLTNLTQAFTGSHRNFQTKLIGRSFKTWLVSAYYTSVREDPYVTALRIPDYAGWAEEVVAVLRGLDEDEADEFLPFSMLCYIETANSEESHDRWFKAVLNRIVDARAKSCEEIRKGKMSAEEIARASRNLSPILRLPVVFMQNEEYKHLTNVKDNCNFFADAIRNLDELSIPGNAAQVMHERYSNRDLWKFVASLQSNAKIDPELWMEEMGLHGEAMIAAVEKMFPYPLPDVSRIKPNTSDELEIRQEVYSVLKSIFRNDAAENAHFAQLIPKKRFDKILMPEGKGKKLHPKKTIPDKPLQDYSTIERHLLFIKDYRRIPYIGNTPVELVQIAEDSELTMSEKYRLIEEKGIPGSLRQLEALFTGSSLEDLPGIKQFRKFIQHADAEIHEENQQYLFGPHAPELAKLFASSSDALHTLSRKNCPALMEEFHSIATKIIGGDYSTWTADANSMIAAHEISLYNKKASILETRMPVVGSHGRKTIELLNRLPSEKINKTQVLILLDELRVPGSSLQVTVKNRGSFHRIHAFATWWKRFVLEVNGGKEGDNRRRALLKSQGKHGAVLVKATERLIELHGIRRLTSLTSTSMELNFIYQTLSAVMLGEIEPSNIDVQIADSGCIDTKGAYISLGKIVKRIPLVGYPTAFHALTMKPRGGKHAKLSDTEMKMMTLQNLDHFGLAGSLDQIENISSSYEFYPPTEFEKWLSYIVEKLSLEGRHYVMGKWGSDIKNAIHAMGLTSSMVNSWEPSMFGHVYNTLTDIMRGKEIEEKDLVPRDNVPYNQLKQISLPFELPGVSLGDYGPSKSLINGCEDVYNRFFMEGKTDVAVRSLLRDYIKTHLQELVSREQTWDIAKYLTTSDRLSHSWQDIWGVHHFVEVLGMRARAQNRKIRVDEGIFKGIIDYAINLTDANAVDISGAGIADPATNLAWYKIFREFQNTSVLCPPPTSADIFKADVELSKTNRVGYYRMPFTRPFTQVLAKIVTNRLLSVEKKVNLLETANLPGTRSQLRRLMRTSESAANFRSEFKEWLFIVLAEFFPLHGKKEIPRVFIGPRQDALLETLGGLDIGVLRNLRNIQEDNLTVIRLYQVLMSVLESGVARNAYREVHITGKFNIAELFRTWLESSIDEDEQNVETIAAAVHNLNTRISHGCNKVSFTPGSLEDTIMQQLMAMD